MIVILMMIICKSNKFLKYEKNTILEVANIAISITSSKSKVFLKDNKNVKKFTRFDLDSDLAKKSFGFEAKVNLKEGMTLMNKKLFLSC